MKKKIKYKDIMRNTRLTDYAGLKEVVVEHYGRLSQRKGETDEKQDCV